MFSSWYVTKGTAIHQDASDFIFLQFLGFGVVGKVLIFFFSIPFISSSLYVKPLISECSLEVLWSVCINSVAKKFVLAWFFTIRKGIPSLLTFCSCVNWNTSLFSNHCPGPFSPGSWNRVYSPPEVCDCWYSRFRK